jgi:hypothetical protein
MASEAEMTVLSAEATITTIVRELEAIYPADTIKARVMHDGEFACTTVGTCHAFIHHPLIFKHKNGNNIKILMDHATLKPYLDCIRNTYGRRDYIVGLTVPGDVKRWYQTNSYKITAFLSCDEFPANKKWYMAMFKLILDLHDILYKDIEIKSFEHEDMLNSEYA